MVRYKRDEHGKLYLYKGSDKRPSEKSEWIEYTISVRPGCSDDVEQTLEDIKKREQDFEYVMEDAIAPSIFTESIVGFTPENWKKCENDMKKLCDLGMISDIVHLIMVRKGKSNLPVDMFSLKYDDVYTCQ